MSFRLRCPLRCPGAFLAILCLLPPALHSQNAADRAALEALRDTLPCITESAQLDQLTASSGSSPTQLIRQGLILLRRATLGTDRAPYDQSLTQVARALDAEPRWPWGWYALGLIELAMWDRHFVAKATPYHREGTTYRRGAMGAFANAIDADSNFAPASEALAGLIVGMGHRLLEQDFAAPLRRAGSAAVVKPVVALAQYRLEFGAGRYDKALDRLAVYLKLGGDSGVAGLESARSLQALNRTSEAVQAYWQALRSMGTDGIAEFRTDIAWIATDVELTEYDSLPANHIPQWIDRFWRERDALAIRAPGERLAEHLRRWVYVHQKYLIHRPDDLPIHAQGQTPNDQANFMENFSVANAMVINDLNSSLPNFKVYTRTQWEVDDRGVIYLRHGAPTKVALDPTGPPNESWQYDMTDGSRIFHFLGSRALGSSTPTTMVAALPLTPSMLDSRGGLDPRYSALSANLQQKIAQATTALQSPRPDSLEATGRRRPVIDTAAMYSLRPGSALASNAVAAALMSAGMSAPTFHPEKAYKEIQIGREAIAVGTTTDGFPQLFKEDLNAVVQVYGVGFAPGENQRLLGVFAVPGRKLKPVPRPGGGPGVVYPVHIRLIALDRENGMVIRRLDTTRMFLTPEPLRDDQHLTGYVELAVPPGRYQVRTLITAPGVDAATGMGRDSVEIPPARNELVISDLILGRQSGGLAWRYGGEVVTLNPLDSYRKGGEADLFYEIGGLNAGSTYQVTSSVRQARSDPQKKPEVQSGFEIAASGPYQAVTRGIGLANLKPGAYLLEVTVTEVGSTRSVTRRRALHVLK